MPRCDHNLLVPANYPSIGLWKKPREFFRVFGLQETRRLAPEGKISRRRVETRFFPLKVARDGKCSTGKMCAYQKFGDTRRWAGMGDGPAGWCRGARSAPPTPVKRGRVEDRVLRAGLIAGMPGGGAPGPPCGHGTGPPTPANLRSTRRGVPGPRERVLPCGHGTRLRRASARQACPPILRSRPQKKGWLRCRSRLGNQTVR